jgi:hypothetical protein
MKSVSLLLVGLSVLALSSGGAGVVYGNRASVSTVRFTTETGELQKSLKALKDRKSSLSRLVGAPSGEDLLASKTPILNSLALVLQLFSDSQARYGVSKSKLNSVGSLQLQNFVNTQIWETKLGAKKASDSGLYTIKINFDGRYSSFLGFKDFLEQLETLPVIVDDFIVTGNSFQTALTVVGTN